MAIEDDTEVRAGSTLAARARGRAASRSTFAACRSLQAQIAEYALRSSSRLVVRDGLVLLGAVQ